MSHLLIVSQEDEPSYHETLNPEDDWIRHVNVIFQNVVDMMTLIEILKAHYCYDALSQVLDIFLLVHYQQVRVVLITARSEDM